MVFEATAAAAGPPGQFAAAAATAAAARQSTHSVRAAQRSRIEELTLRTFFTEFHFLTHAHTSNGFAPNARFTYA